jgi:hypothetical protein
MLFSVNTSANAYAGPRTTRRAGSLLPSAVHGVTAAASTPSNGERSGSPPGAELTQPRSPAAPRDPASATPQRSQFATGKRFDTGPPLDGEEELLAWETRLKEQNLRPRANEDPPPDPGEAATATRRVQQLLREAGPSALAAQSNQTARSVLYLLE